MEDLPGVEAVARDLKRLAAWGAHPHHAASRPALRALPQLGDRPSGEDIVDELWSAVAELDGVYNFPPTKSPIPAPIIKKALWILLHPDSRARPYKQDIRSRREEALMLLRAEHVTEWQWSDGGIALSLMRIPAQHLIERGMDHNTAVTGDTAELTYYFDDVGGWTKVDVIRSFEPRRSGTVLLREPYQECLDWQRHYRGKKSVTTLFGCTDILEARAGEKVYGQEAVIAVKLPNLAKGVRHHFGYSLHFLGFLPSPHSGRLNLARLPNVWLRPLRPFQRFTLTLKFSPKWLPAAAWTFANVEELSILEYTKVTHQEPDPENPFTFTTTFINPGIRLYHGLGWNFVDEHGVLWGHLSDDA